MICKECGYETEEKVKFCSQCGSEMEEKPAKQRFCTSCGSPVTGKFCSKCGTQQSDAPAKAKESIPIDIDVKKYQAKGKDYLNRLVKDFKTNLNEKTAIAAGINAVAVFVGLMILSTIFYFLFIKSGYSMLENIVSREEGIGAVGGIGITFGMFLRRYLVFGSTSESSKYILDVIPLLPAILSVGLIAWVHTLNLGDVKNKLSSAYILIFSVILAVIAQIAHFVTVVHIGDEQGYIKMGGLFRSFIFILIALLLVKLFFSRKKIVQGGLATEVMRASSYFITRLLIIAAIMTGVFTILNIITAGSFVQGIWPLLQMLILFFANIALFLVNILLGGSIGTFSYSIPGSQNMRSRINISAIDMYNSSSPLLNTGLRILFIFVFVIAIILVLLLAIKTMQRLGQKDFRKKAVITAVVIFIVLFVIMSFAKLKTETIMVYGSKSTEKSVDGVTLNSPSLYFMVLLWLAIGAVVTELKYRNTFPKINKYLDLPDFVLYILAVVVVVLNYLVMRQAAFNILPFIFNMSF